MGDGEGRGAGLGSGRGCGRGAGGPWIEAPDITRGSIEAEAFVASEMDAEAAGAPPIIWDIIGDCAVTFGTELIIKLDAGAIGAAIFGGAAMVGGIIGGKVGMLQDPS